MKNKLDDIIPVKYHFRKFGKGERSSFPYWYYHWKAFNVVAKELGVWKFKYLFHDIEKPWLRLFWEYKKVQRWHRLHNSHHIEYRGGLDKIDWEALLIDNESCRFTKTEAGLCARDFINYEIENLPNIANVPQKVKTLYETKCLPLLDKWGI